MIMTCECGVRLYLRYYPEKSTTIKVTCPECKLSQKIMIDLGSDVEASARALKRMRKAKAALDALASEEALDEIQEMFDYLVMPGIWEDRELLGRAGGAVIGGDDY
jgi:hypothetical protein